MKRKSLQAQLLNAGLTHSAKVKAVRSEKRKQRKQQRQTGTEHTDEAKQLAEQARQEQLEKDRLLNRLQQDEADRKQREAQIRQLVEQNRLEQDEAEGAPYNFTDDNKVKRLYLSRLVRDQLIAGRLAIVKSAHRYEVVPVAIAEQVAQRDSSCILVLNKAEQDVTGEDPYAEFRVPDDLMW